MLFWSCPRTASAPALRYSAALHLPSRCLLAAALSHLNSGMEQAEQHMRQVRERVAELQSELAACAGREAAAQQAAASAEEERRALAERLAAVTAESTENRDMVEKLADELARYAVQWDMFTDAGCAMKDQYT